MSRSTRITRLRIDALEARLAPVVGAWANAPPVKPGGGYDGVAMLRAIDADGGSNLATGTLLDSGLYVVTAAHPLTDAEGAITSEYTTVTFQLNDGTADRDITVTVPKSLYKLNKAFGGNPAAGNDIALLPLPDPVTPKPDRVMVAPFGAERHGLYAGTDELGKEFTAVGYGRTGTGYSGGNAGTSGAKRVGHNTFDADAALLAQHPFDSVAPPAGKALAWDFDDGTSTHDAFGSFFGKSNTGLGARESNPAQGDSGGPLFIGDKIAGIVSYSDGGVTPADINTSIDRGFGEFGVATRASAFRDFVATATASPKHVVLDMGYQLAGRDGKTETLTVAVTRAGADVVVTVRGSANPKLNGEYFRGKASALTGLTLRGAGDNEQFQIDPALGVPVIVAGGAGSNTLGMTGGNVVWNVAGVNAGSVADGQVRFSQVQNLQGGAGRDVFRFANLGRVDGAVTGSPGDYLDYSQVLSAVSVNLQTDSGNRVGKGIKGVTNVIGSAVGGDRLTGDPLGGLLLTHGYNNILRAGAGASVLVGGRGPNTLTGGIGDDLLIAGSLSFEKDFGALDRLVAAWQDAAKPPEQRAALTANKTVLLGAAAIIGPRGGRGVVGSTLTGNAGRDWFWTAAPKLIKDRTPGDLLNAVAKAA